MHEWPWLSARMSARGAQNSKAGLQRGIASGGQLIGELRHFLFVDVECCDSRFWAIEVRDRWIVAPLSDELSAFFAKGCRG